MDNIKDELLENEEPLTENTLNENLQQKLNTIKETLDMVLSNIGNKPARSNKHGFYKTDKLDAIDELLKENSWYHLIYKDAHCRLYGKRKPTNDAILVSSHADIVDEITKPFSECENGLYHGTYDNLGTNAVAVTLMLQDNVPDNVFFAFTAEEETGRCTGAKHLLHYWDDLNLNKPFVITLDVTDEGFDKNRLASFEGYNSKASRNFSEYIKDCMMTGEGEEHSFGVIKNTKDEYSPFNNTYIDNGLMVFDESVYYRKKGCVDFSLCLPTNGWMHGNSGLYVKEPTFLGYTLILENFIREFYKVNTLEEKTNLGILKEYLLNKNKEIELPKRTYISSYSYPVYSASNNYNSYSRSYLNMYGLNSYDEDDDDYYHTYHSYSGEEINWDDFYSELSEQASYYSPLSIYDYINDMMEIYGDIITEEELQQIFVYNHPELDDFEDDFEEHSKLEEEDIMNCYKDEL